MIPMMKHLGNLLILASLFVCNGQIINVQRGGLSTVSYELNNCFKMPALGFGTSQLGNSSTTKSAVKTAVQTGYRLIDTATRYENEAEIGEALNELFQQQTVKRDDIFVTTKVWPNSFTHERVLDSIRTSLKNLKLDRLDLVLLHFPAG